MRVFLCGDYQFLSHMFGISGASGTVRCTYMYNTSIPLLVSHVLSGRHCCLWCLVRSDQLKVPPSLRGPVQLRTTESIVRDHERFTDAGGNLRNAKAYNNCICQPFFPTLDLTQVRTCSHTYWINSHKKCTHTCT